MLRAVRDDKFSLYTNHSSLIANWQRIVRSISPGISVLRQEDSFLPRTDYSPFKERRISFCLKVQG